MCYAIPGRVESIAGNIATIDYFGEKKTARNEIPDLKPGEYIYAQGGYVIEIIPAEQALSILNVWKETFFELQEKDLRLSQLNRSSSAGDKKFTSILDKALENKTLKDEDFLYLFHSDQPTELDLLCRTANFLRQKHHGNSCCVHGVIEFSNYCRQSCHYCGISNLNRSLRRYRMSEEEILASVKEAVEVYGFKSLVLQSGEDSEFPASRLAKLVKEIKKKWAVLIFISCGEAGRTGLDQLYLAGARGLLMRFETSNPDIYRAIKPGCVLESRLDHLEYAKKKGFLLATGALIGLPEQSAVDIINDIKLTGKLQPDMYSFGPFVPHPDSPLASLKPPTVETILKSLALARLADPMRARITVTTAFETICPEAVRTGLLAGANSVMLILTPPKYRADYAIYPGRAHLDEKISDQIENTIFVLGDLGRSPTDLGLGE